MIGLDTNILIRYLVQDDEKQGVLATNLIENKLSAQQQGYICSIVLLEIFWSLKNGYKMDKSTIHDIFERLLTCEELAFEHRDLAWKALQLAKKLNVGFVEAFIGMIHQFQGCEKTVTFDKTACRIDQFSYLK